jgi:hypothetical protein
VLKSCLDDMGLDSDISANPFADSDDEDDGKKPKQKDTKAFGDTFAGSLTVKAGKSANATLYYVEYNKAKNGNGLEFDERNELWTKVALAQEQETALISSLKQMADETKKLLSEPTNEDATTRLDREELALAELKTLVEDASKLQVNETHKKQVKRRIENMTAQWRKRRRICMEFLISMEENTDGTISAKKCLAGDGQIEIDSDEVVAKHAVTYGKKKRLKPLIQKRALGTQKAGVGASNLPGIPADENFVAITLDSQGCLQRVYLDDDKPV